MAACARRFQHKDVHACAPCLGRTLCTQHSRKRVRDDAEAEVINYTLMGGEKGPTGKGYIPDAPTALSVSGEVARQRRRWPIHGTSSPLPMSVMFYMQNTNKTVLASRAVDVDCGSHSGIPAAVVAAALAPSIAHSQFMAAALFVFTATSALCVSDKKAPTTVSTCTRILENEGDPEAPPGTHTLPEGSVLALVPAECSERDMERDITVVDGGAHVLVRWPCPVDAAADLNVAAFDAYTGIVEQAARELCKRASTADILQGVLPVRDDGVCECGSTELHTHVPKAADFTPFAPLNELLFKCPTCADHVVDPACRSSRCANGHDSARVTVAALQQCAELRVRVWRTHNYTLDSNPRSVTWARPPRWLLPLLLAQPPPGDWPALPLPEAYWTPRPPSQLSQFDPSVRSVLLAVQTADAADGDVGHGNVGGANLVERECSLEEAAQLDWLDSSFPSTGAALLRYSADDATGGIRTLNDAAAAAGATVDVAADGALTLSCGSYVALLLAAELVGAALCLPQGALFCDMQPVVDHMRASLPRQLLIRAEATAASSADVAAQYIARTSKIDRAACAVQRCVFADAEKIDKVTHKPCLRMYVPQCVLSPGGDVLLDWRDDDATAALVVQQYLLPQVSGIDTTPYLFASELRRPPRQTELDVHAWLPRAQQAKQLVAQPLSQPVEASSAAADALRRVLNDALDGQAMAPCFADPNGRGGLRQLGVTRVNFTVFDGRSLKGTLERSPALVRQCPLCPCRRSASGAYSIGEHTSNRSMISWTLHLDRSGAITIQLACFARSMREEVRKNLKAKQALPRAQRPLFRMLEGGECKSAEPRDVLRAATAQGGRTPLVLASLDAVERMQPGGLPCSCTRVCAQLNSLDPDMFFSEARPCRDALAAQKRASLRSIEAWRAQHASSEQTSTVDEQLEQEVKRPLRKAQVFWAHELGSHLKHMGGPRDFQSMARLSEFVQQRPTLSEQAFRAATRARFVNGRE